jgi:hypothetical protein
LFIRFQKYFFIEGESNCHKQKQTKLKKNGAAKITFAVVSYQSQETREVAFQ